MSLLGASELIDWFWYAAVANETEEDELELDEWGDLPEDEKLEKVSRVRIPTLEELQNGKDRKC